MLDAPIPDNDDARLQALRDYNVLDSVREAQFDDITRVAAQLCHVSMALVTMVDRDRQFFKASTGMPDDFTESPRSSSFCGHAIMDTDVFEVTDTYEDDRFRDNPLVVGEPFLRFYAGVPLLNPDGYALGTLCVLDTRPGQLNDEQKASLQSLARLVMFQLEQRRESEQTLREIRRLAHVARLTDNPVVITDADGFTEWVNPSFESLTGYTLDEVRGKKPGTLLQGPGTDDMARRRIREHLDAGKPVRQEILNYARSGRAYWLELDIQPVRNEQGAISSYVAIETDITRRKEQEDHLRAARDAAEASNRAKSLFLANISHELRTPLNGIVGISEILQRNPARPDLQHQLVTLNESAEGLLAIINDLLDLSKIEADSQVLESVPFDLHRLLEGLRSLFLPQTDKKGLAFELVGLEQVPRYVQGDSLRLRQVLMNLLGNALKFTDSGGIRLTVSREAAIDHTCSLTFTVRDTGIGIPEDALERIFEPFVQANDSLSRRYGGTGLGLAICQRLVRLMGGDIAVESSAQGTRFTFTAPLLVASEVSQEPAPGIAVETADKPLTVDCRVLVVDDNPINRQVAGAMLEELGATVVTCESGAEAIAVFREARFDLALIDIQMPDMDGFALARELRSLEAGRDGHAATPLVALTAYSSAEYLEQEGVSRLDDHITKPLTFANIGKVLAAHLTVSEVPKTVPPEATGDRHLLLDRQLVLHNLSGDITMVKTLTALFIDQYGQYLDSLTSALDQGDLPAVTREAHSLKGAVGYFNNGALWQEVADIEQSGRRGDLEAAWEGFARAKEDIVRLAKILEDVDWEAAQTGH